MGDVLPPKRQNAVDRLERRCDLYRRHQNSCLQRYEQAESRHYEAQRQETLLLKQKFLESKAKKAKNNKSDHHRSYKESVTDGSKTQAHPKPLKRPAEEPLTNSSAECTGEDGEKPSKLLRTDIKTDKLTDLQIQTTQQSQPSLPSFSVQIVQQFSNTSHSQQSQTIQTNVTVQALNKPLTSPVPQPPSTKPSQEPVVTSSDSLQGNIQPGANIECKQEKDCSQADLCQFKGAQNPTSDRLSDTFPSLGFTDDSGDDVIHPDLLKDLIDDVFTNPADIMKDFNFDDSVGSIKDEDDATKDIISDLIKASSPMPIRPFQADNLSFVNNPVSQQQPQQQLHQHQPAPQQSQPNGLFANLSSDEEAPVIAIVTAAPSTTPSSSSFYSASTQRLPSYGNSPLNIPNGLSLDFKMTEPSPAALTLKQMAEQHQNMQQKQQQQIANSSLTNRAYNQDTFNPHLNPLRSANNFLPATNPGLPSPKTSNSNNMFNTFDRQMNNFTNNEPLNNLPISPNNMFDSDIHSRTSNAVPEMDHSKQSNCISVQQRQQLLQQQRQQQQQQRQHPHHHQQPQRHHQQPQQQHHHHPQKQQELLQQQPQSQVQQQQMQQQIQQHQQQQQIQHQQLQQQQQQHQQQQIQQQQQHQQQQPKPPTYASARTLPQFSENPQLRHQGSITNQHQPRPMGRQFPNSIQMMQSSQMRINQGHLNVQQMQQSSHDVSQQQHHAIPHSNQYVNFSSQQSINNPTFHASMSQNMSYSTQYNTPNQQINNIHPASRPPPEYKAHQSVDNVNLVEQLKMPSSQMLFNHPAQKDSLLNKQQRPPNVTINPDGSVVRSTVDWRHMINEQQQNRANSTFRNNYNSSNASNFVRNEQPVQQTQMFNQYRMPSNQMLTNRMIRPNIVPNQMLMQQRPRVGVLQQARNQSPLEQNSSLGIDNSNVLPGLPNNFGNRPDLIRSDGSLLNLDFLDSIESSASDLLNFDQVMQEGTAHFPLLDDMEILRK